uniref:Uncharacterized protein n=1 Tax=Octopus bimaculoides TaxID=37653 RepID=A0A0L8IH89_OCTBM
MSGFMLTNFGKELDTPRIFIRFAIYPCYLFLKYPTSTTRSLILLGRNSSQISFVKPHNIIILKSRTSDGIR